MKKLLFISVMLMFVMGNVSAKKTNYRNALIFAYSSVNNVYEDDNIKLEIYNERLWATNKTQKTIFVDLSQCFLYHNGVARPMVSKEQNKSDKKASKAGISTSITDEFVTIAPGTSDQNDTFICDLTSVGFFGSYTTTESPNGNFSEYETRLLKIIGDMVDESQKANPKEKEYTGTVARHLTEDESVDNLGVAIAYAFNKRAEEWNSVTMSTWVSDIIFAPYCVELPDDLKKKEMRGFGIKETKPAVIHVRADIPFEFEQEKSPVIVSDWEGNYKKGTFELNPTTRISKTKGKGLALGLSLLAGPAALALINETYYKYVIHFDGNDSDWGTLSYSTSRDADKLTQK